MTTHDIPNRRRRAAFVVGASVALGLVASVGLQLADDEAQSVVTAPERHDCPAIVAL